MHESKGLLSRGQSWRLDKCLSQRNVHQKVMDLEDTGFLLKTSNPTWTNDPTSMSNVSILSIHIRTPSYKNARLLMSNPAGDTRNEIHSGVFNLHATEAAPLSEDCGNHFRGHCSLVWKITVRNSASRSKINTRASIHYFFVGGFYPPPSFSLSVTKWRYHFS